MDVADLGHFIRLRRKRAGLTQAALAERAQVSRLTLEKLENGRSAEIGLTKASRLLAALDMTFQVRPKPRRPTLEDLAEDPDD